MTEEEKAEARKRRAELFNNLGMFKKEVGDL